MRRVGGFITPAHPAAMAHSNLPFLDPQSFALARAPLPEEQHFTYQAPSQSAPCVKMENDQDGHLSVPPQAIKEEYALPQLPAALLPRVPTSLPTFNSFQQNSTAYFLFSRLPATSSESDVVNSASINVDIQPHTTFGKEGITASPHPQIPFVVPVAKPEISHATNDTLNSCPVIYSASHSPDSNNQCVQLRKRRFQEVLSTSRTGFLNGGGVTARSKRTKKPKFFGDDYVYGHEARALYSSVQSDSDSDESSSDRSASSESSLSGEGGVFPAVPVSSSLNSTSIFNGADESRPYLCKHEGCNKTFKHRNGLRRHRFFHIGKQFSCPHCNFESHLRYNIERHVMRMHNTSGEVFRCSYDQCKYKTTYSKDLDEHVKKQHLSPMLYCPDDGCNYSTRSRWNLQNHRDAKHLHSGAQPASTVYCGIGGCDYRTVKEYNLARHQAYKHRDVLGESFFLDFIARSKKRSNLL